MRPPRHQSQLKARLLESMRNAETLDNLERIVRFIHHARRTEKLNFSQYQELLQAGDKVRTWFQKGGAA